jgi:hypothetical protein
MAKISHTKIKQPSFGEKRPKLTYTKIYGGSQFYWWKKPEYLEKTTDLSQATDKLLSHIVSSTSHLEQDLNS